MAPKSTIVVPSGGNIKITGVKNSSQYNIAIGHNAGSAQTKVNITANDPGEPWFRANPDYSDQEINTSKGMKSVSPGNFKNLHPIELGEVIDYKNKQEMEELMQEYRRHIEASPWLQKLIKQYDELAEKHKLLDAIRGDDNA